MQVRLPRRLSGYNLFVKEGYASVKKESITVALHTCLQHSHFFVAFTGEVFSAVKAMDRLI